MKLKIVQTANNLFDEKYGYRAGFILSLSFHLMIVAAGLFFIADAPAPQGGRGLSFQVVGEPVQKNDTQTEKKETKEEEIQEKKDKTPVNTNDKKADAGQNKTYSGLMGDIMGTDTSSLKNVYSEKSLNVSIRYPVGWTYIDQHKSKLDGVTFINTNPNLKNPPYVHLEVKDKYYFSESRYRSKSDGKYYTLYYNEPEELLGQVSFIVYVRTDDDYDFSLKLIINTMEAFREYKPTFLAMVKTFRF